MREGDKKRKEGGKRREEKIVGVRRSQMLSLSRQTPAHLLHLYLQCLYLIVNIQDTLLCSLEDILGVHLKLCYLREVEK